MYRGKYKSNTLSWDIPENNLHPKSFPGKLVIQKNSFGGFPERCPPDPSACPGGQGGGVLCQKLIQKLQSKIAASEIVAP